MIKIKKKDIKENRVYQNIDGEKYHLRHEGNKFVFLEAVGNRLRLKGDECIYEKDLFISYFNLIPKRMAE